MEFKIIFVNCKIEFGFIVFLGVRGMLIYLYKEIKFDKLCVYWVLVGVMKRKLFKMCKMDLVLRWWIEIYLSVVDIVLNIV